MTTTTTTGDHASDPHRGDHLDEKSVRDELTREFDVCNGCRRCTSYCTSFPTLFEMLDAHPGSDAGRLAPAQQDLVVDGCFQCGRCAVECPYGPALHELAVDVPRLMQRAVAMRRTNGQTPIGSRITAGLLGRTGIVGRVGTAMPSIANALIGARPGSLRRRIVAVITGLSSVRTLPRFTTRRFSRWFAGRTDPHRDPRGPGGTVVTVFPTCLVEYQAPGIGADLIRVYERNGIACTPSGAGCCGAPWLHAGAIRRFSKAAERNVALLAGESARGDIVVVEPSCARAIAEYPRVVGPALRADAEVVAARVTGPARPLLRRNTDTGSLDIGFEGDRRATITHIGGDDLPGASIEYRELLTLMGAPVEIVDLHSGVGGLWSLRAEHDASAIELGGRLAAALTDDVDVVVGRPGTVITGGSILGNAAIADATGTEVSHPIAVIARACGIAEFDGRADPR